MIDIFRSAIESDPEMLIVFFVLGGAMTILGLIAIFWIAIATVASIVAKSSFEHSRREIAAYIAEGSMTPEQGERLMRANPPADEA